MTDTTIHAAVAPSMLHEPRVHSAIATVDWRAVAEAELHPIRVAVLERAVREEVSPVVLANDLQQRLGTVAYHVRMLVDRGLLRETRTAQRRGAVQHFYVATEQAVRRGGVS